MSMKLKGTLTVIAGVAVILAPLWYLAHQFTSIETQLHRVVTTEIPSIKDSLGRNSERSATIKETVGKLTQQLTDLGIQADSVEKVEANLDRLTKKINDDLVTGIEKLEGRSEERTAEVKGLSRKIDTLSRQYVKFLKLAEDKITVSIPPKWIDALPSREGTVFSVGISPETPQVQKAQQRAVEQALSNMTGMLKRKTTNAVAHTIRVAGKAAPTTFDELSDQFKEQITEAINELLLDFKIESYWIDPSGFVYALISLPIGDRIEGSRFGLLIETLKLTHESVRDALQRDFNKHLKVELLK